MVNVIFAMPARDNNMVEQEQSCRAVCGLCECDGYYCGDECICECNLTNEESKCLEIGLNQSKFDITLNPIFLNLVELECIVDMKKECNKNGLEYELILQGSHARSQREIDEYTKTLAEIEQLKFKRQSENSSNSDEVVGAPALQPENTFMGNSPLSAIKFFAVPDGFTIETFKSKWDDFVGNSNNLVGAIPPLPVLQAPAPMPSFAPIVIDIPAFREINTPPPPPPPQTFGPLPKFKFDASSQFNVGDPLNTNFFKFNN